LHKVSVVEVVVVEISTEVGNRIGGVWHSNTFGCICVIFTLFVLVVGGEEPGESFVLRVCLGDVFGDGLFGLGGGIRSPELDFCNFRKYFCAWLRI